jgi:16S rRNA (guanine(1405)-N(7))-methyltransferase
MRRHASTRERLPGLETFFHRTLGAMAPVQSVLDLACGLNPLALPWMPLAPGFTYLACDVYADLAAFLNGFFTLLGVDGQAQVCDLIDQVPQEPVQLALLLKSIPCLEQVDRQVGLRILEEVRAEHILVSFPAHSLGGRNKGMPENYSRSFRDLLAGKDWQVREFSFPTEVAFLVTRGPGHRGAA